MGFAMINNAIAAQLERALQRRLAQPPEERRADLIRRGVIDAKGRLLLRAPEAPKPPGKAKPKKGKSKQAR